MRHGKCVESCWGSRCVVFAMLMVVIIIPLLAKGGEPAPVVQAVEIESIKAEFSPTYDEPVILPNHPPIEEIPPIPMPFPAEPKTTGAGDFVVYNPKTDETYRYPIDAKSTEELQMGGGYDGADGGGEMVEHLLKSFVNMVKITNTGDFPWRMNCKLVMRFGSNYYVGSGTMRDAETVLTAGHCVYDYSGHRWADEIWVYPGWDGVQGGSNAEKYGWAHSEAMASLTGWTENGNFDYDVGVIAINRGVGMLTGWFGWSYGGDCSWHKSLTYNNASYPAEPCPDEGLHNGRDMYYWYGNFDDCPANQLQLNTGGGHCFDTVWGGMSGSGAYFIDGGGRYVHAICSTSNRYNRGYYCRQIESWVNYLNNTFIPVYCRGSVFDLQPLDCNVAPTTIQAGNSTTLLNHLAVNATNGSANGTWTFRVYLSTDDIISNSDTLLSIQSFTWNFGAMSSVRVNMGMVTIPGNTPPGTYYLGVLYDPATDGNDSNDNTEGWDSVRITVLPAPTPTPTKTPTPTPTKTPTPTPTGMPTFTPTPTRTPTPTPTKTPTPTPPPTPTPTCTYPEVPFNPDPADGATGVSRNTMLRWNMSISQAELYAIDSDLDNLYVLDQTNGAAILIGSTASGPTAPAGLAYNGVNMYTIDLYDGELYTLNLNTGVPTYVGTTGFGGWQGLAADPTDNGQLYGITQSNELYRIATDGTPTFIANGVGSLITALDFDNNGTLWGIEFYTGKVLTIDKSTGAVTHFSTTIAGMQGLDFDKNGVMWAHNTDTDSLYTVNTATGVATLIGPSGTQFVKGLSFGAEIGKITSLSEGPSALNPETDMANSNDKRGSNSESLINDKGEAIDQTVSKSVQINSALMSSTGATKPCISTKAVANTVREGRALVPEPEISQINTPISSSRSVAMASDSFTVINFDDVGAPCLFMQTVALTNEYASLGVIFEGPIKGDGGAILNECGGFGITGHSSPNFLAFNINAYLNDGGIPQCPETITFRTPMTQVTVLAGSNSGAGQELIMEAYDSNNALVDSTVIILNNELRPLGVKGDKIAKVVIYSKADVFVLDDLAFTADVCAPIYDVLFDTQYPPTNLICEDSVVTFCNPGPLNPGTQYYWQVIAKNIVGKTEGRIWSFTTESTPTPTPSPTPSPTCNITCSPNALPENEPCGADTNGGCNMSEPAFTSVNCGDTICGLLWADNGWRDTDWYQLVLTEKKTVTLRATAEIPVLMGFVKTDPPGSGNCSDSLGYLEPYTFGYACEEITVQATLEPGIYWPFIAPAYFYGYPCPGPYEYVLSITCETAPPSGCAVLVFNPNRDLPDRLSQLGFNVTSTVNVGDLTRTNLQKYAVLIVDVGTDPAVYDSQKNQIQDWVSLDGGGFIIAQPSVTGATLTAFPSGFEVYIYDTYWPGYPGSYEAAIVNPTHPIVQGLTDDDLPGNFDWVKSEDIGNQWTIIAVDAETPSDVALLAGDYGNGRLVFTTGNFNSLAADPGSNQFLIQMVNWAGKCGAAPTPTPTPSPTPALGIKVLLLNADYDSGEPIRTQLLAFGDINPCDVFDARYATPSITELQAYDVVITWSNYQYYDSAAIGDVLADYVDSGGKVINTLFSMGTHGWQMQGRFMAENYTAINGTYVSYNTRCLGTYNSLHPIMQGINNVCDFYTLAETYLTPGSTEVARWNNNELFVAVKDSLPVVSICGYVGYYAQWTGQMDELIHNAILWLNNIPVPTPTPSPTPIPTTTPTPTGTPTPIISYDFEGDNDGWVYTPVTIDTYDLHCAGANSDYDGHRIGVVTDNTTNRFGYWQAPMNGVPYEANKLYKFAWWVSTNQSTPALIPTFRFRVNESNNWSYNLEMVLTSVTGDYMPPTVGNMVYNQYVMPINAGNMTPYFDVYDFDVDIGSVFLEQLDVYKLDVPTDGWSAETTPAFPWNWGGTIPPYNQIFSGTTGGLQVSSSVVEERGFGYWWSNPSSIPWTPNQLYRATFNISSADVNTMLGAVRVQSNDYNWAARLRFYGATAPDVDGNPYPIYFETTSGTHFFLNFEGMDFENTRGGTNTLTTVTVERHSIIP